MAGTPPATRECVRWRGTLESFMPLSHIPGCAVAELVLRFLEHLEDAEPSRNGGSARCPAHDDRHNSLSISASEDGRLVVYCLAGCSNDAILRGLEAEARELLAAEERSVKHSSRGAATVQRPAGCTLQQYADAKQLPAEFLRA